jgi:hypothetical protein
MEGLHLIVPQDLNNFTNRYLKLDDTCARLITLVLGVGPERFSETLGDDEGANSMAQIEHEASAVPDHNSGFPLRLSNGIRKLLDGGAILGAPRLGVCALDFFFLTSTNNKNLMNFSTYGRQNTSPITLQRAAWTLKMTARTNLC